MQLFAYDKNGAIVHARHAIKRQDYSCIECGSPVRLRRGLYRQSHYYHRIQERSCQLSGKTETHLQIQNRLQQLFPEGECSLEYQFPLIRRIADVVWHPEKIVFEVQCSPITVEEVESRNRDYASEGYQVVWILHDQRYHRRRESAAERFLRDYPHYYTNINAQGIGMIFDTLRVSDGGLSRFVLGPIQVDLSSPKYCIASLPQAPTIVKRRAAHWPFCFEGDLLSRAEIIDWDNVAYVKFDTENKELIKKSWLGFFLTPYRLLFQILLERYAK